MSMVDCITMGEGIKKAAHIMVVVSFVMVAHIEPKGYIMKVMNTHLVASSCSSSFSFGCTVGGKFDFMSFGIEGCHNQMGT